MGNLFSRDTAVKLAKLSLAVAAGSVVYIWADAQDGKKK